MSEDELAPDVCVAGAANGELRIDFVVRGKHSWLVFRGSDLEGIRQAVDAAIAQREAAK